MDGMRQVSFYLSEYAVYEESYEDRKWSQIKGFGAGTAIKRTVLEQLTVKIWSKKLYDLDPILYLLFHNMWRIHIILF